MSKALVLAAGSAAALLLHPSDARATELEPRSEMLLGASAFVAGYTLGAAPALTGRGNETAAIPVSGPLVWWTTALWRIDARVAYEKANPCQGNSEPSACMGANTSGVDRFFHLTMALPYALATTAAQGAGIVLLVHGASKTDRNKEHARLGFAPTTTGLRLFGTF